MQDPRVRKHKFVELGLGELHAQASVRLREAPLRRLLQFRDGRRDHIPVDLTAAARHAPEEDRELIYRKFARPTKVEQRVQHINLLAYRQAAQRHDRRNQLEGVDQVVVRVSMSSKMGRASSSVIPRSTAACRGPRAKRPPRSCSCAMSMSSICFSFHVVTKPQAPVDDGAARQRAGAHAHPLLGRDGSMAASARGAFSDLGPFVAFTAGAALWRPSSPRGSSARGDPGLEPLEHPVLEDLGDAFAVHGERYGRRPLGRR